MRMLVGLRGTLLVISAACGCNTSIAPENLVDSQTTDAASAAVASIPGEPTRRDSQKLLGDPPELLSTPERGPELLPVPSGTASSSDEVMAPEDTAKPSTRAVAAFAQLLDAAENGSPDQWTAAEARLQELGTEIIPALIPHLTSPKPLAREMSVMFLAQLGPQAAQAAGALQDILDDPSPFVRVNAAAFLSTFDSPPEKAVQTLQALVDHPEAGLRMTAISALGNIPSAAQSTVPQLKRLLNDEESQIRQTTAATLGRLGPVASESLPQLRTLLNDSDPSVKEAALFAIRQLDPETGADVPASAAVTTSAEEGAAPLPTLP